MSDNNFTLNEEQKKLCHELTMEFLHQNKLLKVEEPSKDKSKRTGSHIRNIYFDAYEEIAIGVYDNWKRIQELYH